MDKKKGKDKKKARNLLSRLRREKDKSPQYQIIGHGGVRDGVMLGAGEMFTRSWTISNVSTSSSKEKGKVAKLVHCKGYVLKQTLLFLWPLPGKSVTVNMELSAPLTPGWYESYWRMEGKEEADFWVKFEVIPDESPEPFFKKTSSTTTIDMADISDRSEKMLVDGGRRATLGDLSSSATGGTLHGEFPHLAEEGFERVGPSPSSTAESDEERAAKAEAAEEEGFESDDADETESDDADETESDDADEEEDAGADDGSKEERAAKEEAPEEGEVEQKATPPPAEAADKEPSAEREEYSSKEAADTEAKADEDAQPTSDAPKTDEKSDDNEEEEEKSGEKSEEEKSDGAEPKKGEAEGEEAARDLKDDEREGGDGRSREENVEEDAGESGERRHKKKRRSSKTKVLEPGLRKRGKHDKKERAARRERKRSRRVEREKADLPEDGEAPKSPKPGRERSKHKRRKEVQKAPSVGSETATEEEEAVRKERSAEKGESSAGRREKKEKKDKKEKKERREKKQELAPVARSANGVEESGGQADASAEQSASAERSSSSVRRERSTERMKRLKASVGEGERGAGLKLVGDVDAHDTQASSSADEDAAATPKQTTKIATPRDVSWEAPPSNEAQLRDLMFAAEAAPHALPDAAQAEAALSDATLPDTANAAAAEAPTQADGVRPASVVKKWAESVTSEKEEKQESIAAAKRKELLDRQLSVKSLTKKRLTAFARFSDDTEAPEALQTYTYQRRSSVVQVETLLKSHASLANAAAVMRGLQGLLTDDTFQGYEQLGGLSRQCGAQLEAALGSMAELRERVGLIMFQKSSIGCIPDAIWSLVFSYLDPASLAAVARVSKTWNRLAGSDDVWGPLYVREQGKKEFPRCKLAADFSYKQLFKISRLYRRWFVRGRMWEDVTETSAPELLASASEWPIFDLAVAGDQLCCASQNLRFFDLRGNAEVGSFRAHEKVLSCVALSPEGDLCVTGSVDQTVKVWDVQRLSCAQVISGHSSAVASVGIIGKCVISACTGPEPVRLWNVDTGDLVHEISRQRSSYGTVATNATADGVIYLGGSTGSVVAWDLKGQRETSVLGSDLSGPVEGLAVWGNLLAASDGGHLVVTDLRSNVVIAKTDHLGRSIRRLKLDDCRLGVQLGNCLDIYDLRYLYNMYSSITLDKLWKGAFAFRNDGVLVGGGDGSLCKWEPVL